MPASMYVADTWAVKMTLIKVGKVAATDYNNGRNGSFFMWLATS